MQPEELHRIQEHISNLHVSEKVRGYLVDLTTATRNHKGVSLGLSPRGVLIWQRLAQAEAHLRGRDFVTPDDMRAMAYPVLTHRIVLRPEYEIEGVTVAEAIAKLLEKVAVPR